MKRWFIALILMLAGAPSAVHAFSSSVEILDLTGNADIICGNSVGWTPLSRSSAIMLPARIRVQPQGVAELSLDRQRETVFELKESAVIQIKNKSSIHLDKGTLLVSRQNDEIASWRAENHFHDPLRLTTKKADCLLKHGGVLVQIRPTQTIFKVFAEEIQVALGTDSDGSQWIHVAEGSKLIVSDSQDGSQYQIRRLSYGDYGEWQQWTKQLYRKKDARAKKTFDVLLKR